jgi:hypothetical protein
MEPMLLHDSSTFAECIVCKEWSRCRRDYHVSLSVRAPYPGPPELPSYTRMRTRLSQLADPPGLLQLSHLIRATNMG